MQFSYLSVRILIEVDKAKLNFRCRSKRHCIACDKQPILTIYLRAANLLDGLNECHVAGGALKLGDLPTPAQTRMFVPGLCRRRFCWDITGCGGHGCRFTRGGRERATRLSVLPLGAGGMTAAAEKCGRFSVAGASPSAAGASPCGAGWTPAVAGCLFRLAGSRPGEMGALLRLAGWTPDGAGALFRLAGRSPDGAGALFRLAGWPPSGTGSLFRLARWPPRRRGVTTPASGVDPGGRGVGVPTLGVASGNRHDAPGMPTSHPAHRSSPPPAPNSDPANRRSATPRRNSATAAPGSILPARAQHPGLLYSLTATGNQQPAIDADAGGFAGGDCEGE